MSKITTAKIVLVVSVFTLVIGGATGYYITKKINGDNPVKDITDKAVETIVNYKPEEEESLTVVRLEESIKDAQELVTLKYCYKDVAIYEQSKKIKGTTIPLTTDRFLYTYTGEIKAGIDLEKIKIELDEQNKKIMVLLPSPEILSHTINPTGEEYDVKNSIFTEINLQKYEKEKDELKKEQETSLKLNSEFMNQVTDNAKLILQNLMTVADTEHKYTVVFYDNSDEFANAVTELDASSQEELNSSIE